MTSPEPRDSPERLSSPGDSNSNGENGEEQLDISVTKERKTSGGFFAKRFGITKMKDHSTKKDRLIDTNSANNSPMEFKPLKVGLVKTTWHSIATLPPPLVKTAESNVTLTTTITGACRLPAAQARVQGAAKAKQLQGDI